MYIVGLGASSHVKLIDMEFLLHTVHMIQRHANLVIVIISSLSTRKMAFEGSLADQPKIS